ncbi:hypothetical protein ACFX13_029670 [Malus domestica]
MWSKPSCCLNTNRKAVANLVKGFRFGTAAIYHHNGSTSSSLCHREKSPHSTKSLLMQGRSYGVSILGRPSPYSMNNLLLGRPSPCSMDHPMAPARFSVEEYNRKKDNDRDYIVDWRPIMGPIRDQGDSSHCWAISTCVCAEALYALETRRRVMLSPQSIARRFRVSRDRGYNLMMSFRLMNTSGAILEKDWPYMGKRKKVRFSLVKLA